MTDININVDLSVDQALLDKLRRQRAESRQQERPFVPKTIADSSVLPNQETRAGSTDFSTNVYTSSQSLSRNRDTTGVVPAVTSSFSRQTFTQAYNQARIKTVDAQGRKRYYDPELGVWVDEPDRLLRKSISDGFITFQFEQPNADTLIVENTEYDLPYDVLELPDNLELEQITVTTPIDQRNEAPMTMTESFLYNEFIPSDSGCIPSIAFAEAEGNGFFGQYIENRTVTYNDGQGGGSGGFVRGFYLPYTEEYSVAVWAGFRGDLRVQSTTSYTTVYNQTATFTITYEDVGGQCGGRAGSVSKAYSYCTSGFSEILSVEEDLEPLVLCFLVGTDQSKAIETPAKLFSILSDYIGGQAVFNRTSSLISVPKDNCPDGQDTIERLGGFYSSTGSVFSWNDVFTSYPSTSTSIFTPAIYSLLESNKEIQGVDNNRADWLEWYKKQPGYYQEIDLVASDYDSLVSADGVPALEEPDNVLTWNWNAANYCESRLLALGFRPEDLYFSL